MGRATQPEEVHALDPPPAVDVQARDDPDGDGHQATATAAAFRACSRVNAPAYRALPTIAPSTPAARSPAIASRSARLDTPPLAITGRSVRAQTRRSRSRFAPPSIPSFMIPVPTYPRQPGPRPAQPGGHPIPGRRDRAAPPVGTFQRRGAEDPPGAPGRQGGRQRGVIADAPGQLDRHVELPHD